MFLENGIVSWDQSNFPSRGAAGPPPINDDDCALRAEGSGITMFEKTITIHLLGGSAALEAALRAVPAPTRLHCALRRFPDAEGTDWRACDLLIVDLPDGEALKVLPLADENTEVILCAGAEELAAAPGDRAYADLWVRPVPAFLPARRMETLLRTYWQRFEGALAMHCLDTTINSIPDLVWFKDIRGSHEKVNDAFCRAVGKTKEDVQGRGHYYIWDMDPEEYAAGEYICLESEDEVMRRRETCLFDEKVLSKHGLRRFKTYKSPLFDAKGQIIGTMGVGRDVTDFENITAELEILLRSMPYGILIEGTEGQIIKTNEKVLEYFGLPREAVEGRPYEDWKREYLADAKQDGDELLVMRGSGEDARYFRFCEDMIYDVFQNPAGHLCTLRDVTVEWNLRERLVISSDTDFLTGLYNRRCFYRFIRENRDAQRTSLVYLDLDRFKDVNDAYGHRAGDDALVLAAQTLRESFREGFITRLGGDEFLITLLGPVELEELEKRTKQLLRRMRASFQKDPRFTRLSASAGIAQSDDPAEQIDTLIQRSDAALYAAKQQGRNCLCIH